VNIPFLLKEDWSNNYEDMHAIKKRHAEKKCQVQSSVPLYILVNIY